MELLNNQVSHKAMYPASFQQATFSSCTSVSEEKTGILRVLSATLIL